MMQRWSRTLTKVIPSLFFAMVCLSVATVCFAVDPSPVPADALVGPSAGIGGWVHSEGGFVAAIVALMLSVLAILKAVHDVCLELKISEPGWLGSVAGFIAKALSYLTANTVPDQSKTAPPKQ